MRGGYFKERGSHLAYSPTTVVATSRQVVVGSLLQIADISFTLTENEVAQGMILTCMSRPVSDEVRFGMASRQSLVSGLLYKPEAISLVPVG